MQETLKRLEQDALSALEKADTLERAKEIEGQYLGRSGHITMILRGMKDLSDEEKRVVGPLCNATKITLETAFEKKIKEFEDENLAKELSKEFFDTTIPGSARSLGHIHPLSQLQEEVERIFSQMGFTVADGPEIESEYYNFEGLNIPKDHPARDMQDTFFIQEKDHKDHLPTYLPEGMAGQAGGRLVLRTQTSPVQIRMMEKHGAPLRLIVPGRVFRFEATDASHDSMFYQVEGLLVDKDISLAHLKGVLAEFLTRLFGKPVKVRFRPGYFPFVEPGLEVDFSCLLCEGKGCRVCKHCGWMEFMGAGMVHENVLKAGGINPKEYQGWAFGFGLTRLVMMRYGIDDIRLLTNSDLRFNKQF